MWHKKLQTHNRGTFCGLNASKRETLPATKPKSLNNRENDEKNLSRSLAGVEPALLSPGGKLCNPTGFGDTARPYTMEEFTLLGPTASFRLNNSFVPPLHPDCSSRHQNCVSFGSREAGFTGLV